MNNTKKRGFPSFRVIAGLLCLCVGLLFSSAALSLAWQTSGSLSVLSLDYPFDPVELEELEELELDIEDTELALALLELEDLDVDAEEPLDDEDEAGLLEDFDQEDAEEEEEFEEELLDEELPEDISDNDGTEDSDNIDSAVGETDAADDASVGTEAATAVYEVWSYDSTFSFDEAGDSE